MTSAPDSEAWPLRFGVQLKALGELSETLTLRLLELEERLGRLEEHQAHLLAGRDQEGVDSAAVMDLLEQTDDRLSRLEALLEQSRQGPAASALPGDPVRPLRVLGDAAPSPGEFGSESVFPEEGEQPFMDELIA
ncbi:hypothetical protein I1E95_10930 [Synechococcus sp. CBW1107]|uniref:hypothetical protein n=1 Tax=Synechococcus sp. CBW1107 TaxID=2789857 RepID=UPI0018CD1122|nr:hypothetical protein [Synechococcus sp. CBW1107]QPN55697.1 hypothetical protein I1E95_10930 [Synechococcus sp. CBW1107]